MKENLEEHQPQFSVKFADGFLVNLKKYIPFVGGAYISPNKNMRKAIKEHYPERLHEFDTGMKKKEDHLNFLDRIINRK